MYKFTVSPYFVILDSVFYKKEMYEVHSKSSRTGRISQKVDVLSFLYFIYTFFESILIYLSVFASFYANIIEI